MYKSLKLKQPKFSLIRPLKNSRGNMMKGINYLRNGNKLQRLLQKEIKILSESDCKLSN